MKNNQHYFKISQKNPEIFWDENYVFFREHALLGDYVVHTKKIKELLITIKILLQKKEKRVVLEKYFDELLKLLAYKKEGKYLAVCSEFSGFINACDKDLQNALKNKPWLWDVLEKYFQNRILTESVPPEWVQNILDKGAGRRKGNCADRKLISILESLDYKQVSSWQDFKATKKVVARCALKEFKIGNLRQKLKINPKVKQNKNLDLVIKNNDKIFILEAKHQNMAGGGQNSFIDEIIRLLNFSVENPNIFYVSFFDGVAANEIFGNQNGDPKLRAQQKEILDNLATNKHNFLVNTAGFKELFK
ncbi:hypothetical protein KKF38_00330 [Patescibacteria group bacterium]|nr:hypothetical protein [Patescibacteria group bacterium]